MIDSKENNTAKSSHLQQEMPQIIINETVEGKTIKKKYNRYISKYEQLPDKPIRTFFANGKPSLEKLPDGTIRTWHENGQLKSEDLPDGSERWWYDDGIMRSEYLPNGISRGWYKNGQISSENLPDGTSRTWYKTGQIKREILSDFTETRYDENHNIIKHFTNNKEDTEVFLKAKKRREILRKIVSQKIDNREKMRSTSEKKSYERVIKNKPFTKFLVWLKAASIKEN